MSGSQFTLAPNLAEFMADNVPFQAGRRTYPDPNSIIKPMGVISTTIAPAAISTGTGEQTLSTFSLPAYALDKAARKLFIRAQFFVGNNTHNKTCRLYFGSVVFSSGAVATASANLAPVLEMYVTQRVDSTASSPNSQIVCGAGLGGTTGIVPVTVVNLAAESISSPIIISATGQTDVSTASDITLIDFFIQYMN